MICLYLDPSAFCMRLLLVVYGRGATVSTCRVGSFVREGVHVGLVFCRASFCLLVYGTFCSLVAWVGGTVDNFTDCTGGCGPVRLTPKGREEKGREGRGRGKCASANRLSLDGAQNVFGGYHPSWCWSRQSSHIALGQRRRAVVVCLACPARFLCPPFCCLGGFVKSMVLL